MKQIKDLKRLEVMLLILLEATSTKQVSFSHIILDFFRLELMNVEQVISPVTLDDYYSQIENLDMDEIKQLIIKKLKLC